MLSLILLLNEDIVYALRLEDEDNKGLPKCGNTAHFYKVTSLKTGVNTRIRDVSPYIDIFMYVSCLRGYAIT
jgi:hypothetical protein